MSFLECVSTSVPRADVLERYVEFVGARYRPNTVIATMTDLRVFFAVIDRPPWRSRRRTGSSSWRRNDAVQGTYRRRGHGCTRRDGSAPADDLVGRQFDPEQSDRLWVMDVTEHPTGNGKVYLAVVLDAYARRVVGWSIAHHIRSELVVDALQMAIWRRQPFEHQTSRTQITDRSTRHGRSVDGSAAPACSAR